MLGKMTEGKMGLNLTHSQKSKLGEQQELGKNRIQQHATF
jgi:hypothetical protein